MPFLSRYRYYGASIATLLAGFDRPGQILSIFLGRSGALPATVRLRRTGWQFRVRQALDVWVIKETCLDGDYFWGEPPAANAVIVDIGAGLGDFSVLAAKLCPDGRVHAYEPLAESFALLQQNLALNQIGNAEAYEQACAADSPALAPLDTTAEAVSTRFSGGKGEGSVPAVNLATILDRLPGGRCDFLKIDCEGCEYDLLLNSPPEVLARIACVSAETHAGFTSHSPAELAAYLEKNGFSVRRRPNPVHTYLGFLLACR